MTEQTSIRLGHGLSDVEAFFHPLEALGVARGGASFKKKSPAAMETRGEMAASDI
jgi:hypothetical protein